MREYIRLIETAQQTPAEIFIEKSYQYTHTNPNITLVMLIRGDNIVSLEQIEANPTNQGYGTKALNFLCMLADQYKVILLLEVEQDYDDDDDGNDFDDEQDYDDDFDEDNDNYIASDDLVNLYYRFGFEIRDGSMSDNIQMIRRPTKKVVG